jgi:probable poly-beta-1,6-N-acetyl-D-glucosamine export protein
LSRQLGALTGIAMILIVLNHTIAMGLGHLNSPVVGWEKSLLSILQALGVFAVPVFFFTSGSFLAYAAQSSSALISRKFLWSSLRHIVIPYVIWSVLFYILIYFNHGTKFSLLGYLKNLLVGYPFHFIPLLVFYYIFSPFLVNIARRFPGIFILGIALVQLFLLNISYPGIHGFTFPERLDVLLPPILGQRFADWGIYFPLGLVFGLHARSLTSWANKFAWLIGILTLILFVLGILSSAQYINFPLAYFLSPVTFMLIIPAIPRHAIPFVRKLEHISKRSYGIYLTHLIIMDLTLLFIQVTLPFLFSFSFLLLPLLFILGIQVPIIAMDLFSRAKTIQFYRYVFG